MVIFLVQLNDDHTSGRNMNKQIAEQDKKIAEQDKKISEQDEKIAQQDKKIVEQDEKIADQAIKNAEQDEKMAQIVRNVKLIQTHRQTRRPWTKALSGNIVKYSIINFTDIIITFLVP